MTVGKKVAILLLLIAVIADTIPRWIHGLMFCGRSVYYLGDALAFLLIIIAGMIKDAKGGYVQVVYEFISILVFNNFYDEMWGDPRSFGWNEKILGIVSVVWIILRVTIKCLKPPPEQL